VEEGLRRLVEWRRQVISNHQYDDYAVETTAAAAAEASS
jgi:hypothetical protein